MTSNGKDKLYIIIGNAASILLFSLFVTATNIGIVMMVWPDDVQFAVTTSCIMCGVSGLYAMLCLGGKR